MSRFTQPSQDESNYILVARMDNARNLSSILKAVNFREVQFSLSLSLSITHTQACIAYASSYIYSMNELPFTSYFSFLVRVLHASSVAMVSR